MSKQTITKGDGSYKGGSDVVKINLPEPKQWKDLELWLDIRAKSELFDAVSMTVNFAEPIPALKLTTPGLQQNFGVSENIQELRLPLSNFHEELSPEVLNAKIDSLDVAFDIDGVVEFYYRVKE